MNKLIIVFLISFLFITANSFAGAQNGPQSDQYTVKANSSLHYKISFVKKQTAVVQIIGDNSTDLYCYIFDNDNKLLDYDNNQDNYCSLVWTPKYTGTYSIRIKNVGNKNNQYTLQTN